MKPRTPAEYRALESRGNALLLNRADQGGYPTGSAFKPIVATAALEEGLVVPDEIVYDGGALTVGGVVFQNAGGAVNGAIDMSDALKVSSDVYFYRLGAEASAHGRRGQIQDWARSYGIETRPGLTFRPSRPACSPRPPGATVCFRKQSLHRASLDDRRQRQPQRRPGRPADALQLATAYAALANGGAVVTPHLGARIDAVNGRTLARIRPPPRRHLRISDLTRETILHGMERAAMEPGGTSYSVFEASRSRSRARPAPRSEARGRGPVVVRGDRTGGRAEDHRRRDCRGRRLRR